MKPYNNLIKERKKQNEEVYRTGIQNEVKIKQ